MPKKIKIILALILLIPSLSWGKSKIDFKFTTDQNLTVVEEPFTPDDDKSIENDDYLNKPLTRLDYFLMQFKEELEDNVLTLINIFNSEYLDLYFKKYIDIAGWEKKEFDKNDFDSFVWFNEQLGKIIIGVNVTEIGEPLVPLSELCESIIKYDIGYVAVEAEYMGNWYQNVILNELFRGDDYRNYDAIFQKIAKNISFYVSLNSEYDNNVYNINCYKDNGSDEIKYSKYSFSLSN